MAAPMARAMAMMAHTELSRPDEMPDSTVVAGPVRADSAISRTGAVSVDVKYSVMRLASWASTRPTTTAPNMRQPTFEMAPAGLPTYTRASTSVPSTVRMPAVRKPRLMGVMADRSLAVDRTAKTATSDASTPSGRCANGTMADGACGAG